MHWNRRDHILLPDICIVDPILIIFRNIKFPSEQNLVLGVEKSIIHGHVPRALFTALGHGSTNFLPRQFNEFDLERYFIDVSTQCPYLIRISWRWTFILYSFLSLPLFVLNQITAVDRQRKLLPDSHRDWEDRLREPTSGTAPRSCTGEFSVSLYGECDTVISKITQINRSVLSWNLKKLTQTILITYNFFFATIIWNLI